MQIGQLAKLAGVAVDTVRYYESHGILPPPTRQASGYRSYDDDDVARLLFVRRSKALGFTLREIRELLELCGRQHEDMGVVRDAAALKLADIESRLAELERIREGLRTLIDACPGHGDMAHCPILGALSAEDA